MHKLRLIFTVFIIVTAFITPSRSFAGRCDIYKKFATMDLDDNLERDVTRVCKNHCSIADAEEIYRRRKGKTQANFKGRDAHAHENEQFSSIVNELHLNKAQRRQLHDEISHEGMSRREIMDYARTIFER